jgi:hypothetical protein
MRKSISKCLELYFPNLPKNMPIEIICIVGKIPYTGSPLTHDEIENQLRPLNARLMTYDELIQSALISYNDYLKANERISSLVAMLNGIDSDFTNSANIDNK